MKTKTYTIVCPSCNGTGYIFDKCGIVSSTTNVCPACNGYGIISCIESED